MKFQNWIEKKGIDNVARLLKLHRTTVWKWLRGKNAPTRKHMEAIKKLSKGRITYKDILESFSN